MPRHRNAVNCPMCNTPRTVRLVTVQNSGKTLCSTVGCRREILTSDTIIPKQIEADSLYKERYAENFRSIGQGLVVLGSVQAIFNVRLSSFEKDLGVEEVVAALKAIHQNQVYSYKVALSFGRLLTCTDNGEEKVMYFHASANNSSVFYDSDNHHDPYFLVKNDSDFAMCLEVIRGSVLEDTSRPNTMWAVIGNVNANITLLRPGGANVFLGRLDSVPTSFRKKGMKHFHRDPTGKKVYKDNLCFFRCVAYHLHKSTKMATSLFKQAYPGQNLKQFKGVTLGELDRLKELFDINVRVFSLVNRKHGNKPKKVQIKVVRSKLCSGENVINLNMYKSHLSLITNMGKYGKLYSCDRCHKVLTSAYNMKRHSAITKDCTKVRFLYKGGVYKPPKTIFQKLSEVGVHTPDELKIYPYKIVYDFESYFTKNTSVGGNTNIELDHIPLSASVASDFPGYTKPVCFVRCTNRDNDPIVSNVLEYINDLGSKINAKVLESFKCVTEQLDVLEEQEKKLEEVALKNSKLKTGAYVQSPIQRLRQALMLYINRVPVVGFNSGRYDLNLIKRDFHSFFSAKEKKTMATIKRCNQYIAVYTQNLVFLDMFNYLAPGYSYANYLKAFLKDTRKGFFPYEWMNNVEKLKNKKLPTRSAFFSSLTQKGLTLKEYKSCQAAWKNEK